MAHLTSVDKRFDLRNVGHVGVVGIGFKLLGLLTERMVGLDHGGNI